MPSSQVSPQPSVYAPPLRTSRTQASTQSAHTAHIAPTAAGGSVATATVVSCNPCIAAPLPATTATTFTPLILGNHTVNLAPIITIALPTADATSSETASTKSTNSQTTTTPRPISAQAPAPSSSVSAT
ncbi:MAG: hypothetical protein WDW36_000091 [Sanguina aurantia]